MSGDTIDGQRGWRVTTATAAWMLTALAGIAPGALAERADDRTYAVTKVKELDSDLVKVRENAEDALRGWSRNQTDRVLSLIEPAASAEQRDRLLSLARSVFDSSPRGAMGVSFGYGVQQFGGVDEEVFEGGIPIRATTPGFDSDRVLKAGDVLVSIDGVPVRTVSEARIQIISHDAGQVTRVEVEREGKVLQLSLRLGKWSDLWGRNARGQGGNDVTPAQMDGAFRARLARVNPGLLALDTRPTLRPVPGALAWAEGERLADDPLEKVVLLPETGNLRLGPGIGPGLGENRRQVTRIGIDGRPQRVELDSNGNATVADLRGSGGPRDKVTTPPGDAELRTSRAQVRRGNLNPEMLDDIRLLQLQRSALEQQANLWREQLKDRRLDAEIRRGMQLMLDKIEGDIAALDAQIDRMQRRGNRNP
ncbi:MAG: PDZ domain-containing protein [Phycisphaerales bacterium]|nr:PDZ domain-containing protein [Phycisphaerales bacterium]